MRIRGFEPNFDENSKILILGSFPSVKSRENHFYYGNPRNRFWGVLAKSFSKAIPQTILEKKEFLFENNVALWDIVCECEIEGSLDSAIKDYIVSDLKRVINNSHIQAILLNGLKATEIFKRNYPEYIDISVSLPSTSPANVKFDETMWLDVLKLIK